MELGLKNLTLAENAPHHQSGLTLPTAAVLRDMFTQALGIARVCRPRLGNSRRSYSLIAGNSNPLDNLVQFSSRVDCSRFQDRARIEWVK